MKSPKLLGLHILGYINGTRKAGYLLEMLILLLLSQES